MTQSLCAGPWSLAGASEGGPAPKQEPQDPGPRPGPPDGPYGDAAVDDGAGVDEEADPFGLDALLTEPKREPMPPPPPRADPPGARGEHGGGAGEGEGAVWTAAQCLVMRRQALIEILITAKCGGAGGCGAGPGR